VNLIHGGVRPGLGKRRANRRPQAFFRRQLVFPDSPEVDEPAVDQEENDDPVDQIGAELNALSLNRLDQVEAHQEEVRSMEGVPPPILEDAAIVLDDPVGLPEAPVVIHVPVVARVLVDVPVLAPDVPLDILVPAAQVPRKRRNYVQILLDDAKNMF
jgi:hypothetical protein